MSYRIIFYFKAVIWITVAVFTLGACDVQAPTLSPSPATTQAVLSSPQSTLTEALATESPTPTYVPLVATVNGEPISLAEYQIELALFQNASAAELTEEDETRVLDNLIEQTLLAQAASQNGFSLDEASLETRIQQLADQMGSPICIGRLDS